MDQENAQGKVQEGVGTVKEKVGGALGDPTLVAEGQNDQDEGRMHEVIGTVREKMGEAAGVVGAAAGVVKEKAEELGERLHDAAQRVTHHSDDPAQADKPKP